MNDPYITELMPHIRKWCAMPLDDAKQAMKLHMETEGGHSELDFSGLAGSLDIQEAIGFVYGVDAI